MGCAQSPSEKLLRADRSLQPGARTLRCGRAGRTVATLVRGGVGPMVEIKTEYVLEGPPVAANDNDHKLLVMGSHIVVITDQGKVFAHDLPPNLADNR